MIVDCHTHVFPSEIAGQRDRLLEAEPAFAELYAGPKATLASAEDLLAGMQRSGIDVSVMLGFAWADAGLCRCYNDYLLEAARKSDGRLLAFCALPLAAGADAIEAEMRRCVGAGARGFGELRPENLGFELAGPTGDRLAAVAAELNVPLLFHVSEPVGHRYAGKRGLSLAAFYDYACAQPRTTLIGAHWAGGLPFYGLMPEVQDLANVFVDTAATSLLYRDDVYRRVVDLYGAGRILFGSDYPLLAQARSRRRIDEAGLDPVARDLILGGNAAALLRLA